MIRMGEMGRKSQAPSPGGIEQTYHRISRKTSASLEQQESLEMLGSPPPTLGNTTCLRSGPRAHGRQPGIRHKLGGLLRDSSTVNSNLLNIDEVTAFSAVSEPPECDFLDTQMYFLAELDGEAHVGHSLWTSPNPSWGVGAWTPWRWGRRLS